MNITPDSVKKLNFDELVLCMEAITVNSAWKDGHPVPIIIRECVKRMRSMKDQKSKTERKTPDGVVAMFALTGFDDCVLGVVAGDGRPDAVAYDVHKVLSKLQETMTHEEAMEYFDFNIAKETPQNHGPVFVRVCDMDHVKYLLGIDSQSFDGN